MKPVQELPHKLLEQFWGS